MSLRIPEVLNPVLGYPVAVFGGGVSGRAVLALLKRIEATGELFDERQEDAKKDFTAADAASHRLVIFSPGFRPEHSWLATARKAGCMCLGELDFAALFWRGTVLAVTGTNGKTTLTEFLTHALREAKREAYATGNVGYSFSQLVLDQQGGVFDDIAVCEVSSFQSETFVHFRADATLWTNFAEDHLERHSGLRAYFDAKWRLLDRTLGGVVLTGSSVQKFAVAFGRALSPDSCIATENQPADVLLSGTIFEHYPQRENFMLAAAWWRHAGLPETALYAAALSFKLGRHRLARVAQKFGVTYWNDSKATNFHAVEAALASFASPVLLILGGRAKGGDLTGFVGRIAPRVKHAFIIGETSHILADACLARHLPHSLCVTLADAVENAAARATEGDHVLLSPGFASFDMFRSYEDRGEQFERLVNNLGISVPKH